MESSACKIVGYVEYNGEALVQLGFKWLPRRTHPSGTPNSGSQLFLATSSSLPLKRFPVILSLVRRQIYNHRGLSRALSRFSFGRLFSTESQLDPWTVRLGSSILFSPWSRFARSRPRGSFSSLVLAGYGPVRGPPIFFLPARPRELLSPLPCCVQGCRDYFTSFRDVDTRARSRTGVKTGFRSPTFVLRAFR